MTYSIQLDIAHDCPIEILNEFVDTYGLIGYKMIEEFGPGGGNPIYEFTAKSKIELEGFVLTEMCLDDEDEYNECFAPYIEQI